MDWYYADGNERKGPVDDEALAELAATGAVVDSTLVWRPGFAEWQQFGSVRPGAIVAEAPSLAFCNLCGRQASANDLVNLGGRYVCAACKPTALQQMREGIVTSSGRVYAGFWLRFAALMIDSTLLSVVNLTITMAILGAAAFTGDPTASLAGMGISILLNMAVAVSYESWFLVNKGATLGKLAVGLRVIRHSGAPITWGLAIGRYFARVVSSMILYIGFLMAVWDEEKRGLHDRICDTRVIKV
jgi:uncharacterized RDD family membrane protein YckC